jgi:hypothetical protein
MTVPTAQRLCIRLDPAMLLEGLLFERLALVPKARRQEWLRGLLVQGYLWEGRTGRGVRSNDESGSSGAGQAENKVPASAKAFAGWLTRPQTAVPKIVAEGDRPPRAVTTRPRKPVADKPFAHLRKVIG